ncbi:hypothetical protein [Mesorhizobium sp. ORM16]|uniref:hypothetical protein n=1 Tax=Mesorhizobium sp. ORM16 TaxID=3376989 RepID=UPI003857321B
MSRWLVSTLSMINGFMALAIFSLGGLLGGILLGQPGLILGFIGGFLAAAILCGGLAALCLIEKHLRVLADDLRKRQKAIAPTRTEPSIR